jgi:formylglycine-generating enzyme required for sulfatase activity
MRRPSPLLAAWLLASVLAGAPLHAQGQAPERADAALTPVGTLGEFNETEKRIIFFRIQTELSKHYRLVPQEEYAKAEDRAFRELEVSKCTEEQCIRKIQELLQVERLFALQLLRERSFTQVVLTLVRPGDKIVRDDSCEGCPIGQLYAKVAALVEQIVAADRGVAPPVVAPAPAVVAAPVLPPAQTLPPRALPTPAQPAPPKPLQQQQAASPAPPPPAVVAAPAPPARSGPPPEPPPVAQPAPPKPLPQQQAAVASTPSGQTWREPITGMEFVSIPGGEYEQGCHSNAGECQDDEKPTRRVRLSPFWLGKTEVTQGQWQLIMGSNPSSRKKGDDYPVESVSWNAVQEFIRILNAQGLQHIYRLPTEAEWEYACRAGGRAVTYGTSSGDLDRGNANFENSSGPNAAGSYPANALGLHDMSGNVREWVQDVYSERAFGGGSTSDPIYMGSGDLQVLRGGGWTDDPRFARCSVRGRNHPARRVTNLGFRLARTP